VQTTLTRLVFLVEIIKTRILRLSFDFVIDREQQHLQDNTVEKASVVVVLLASSHDGCSIELGDSVGVGATAQGGPSVLNVPDEGNNDPFIDGWVRF
jgi:hypothetical protein